MAGIDDTYIVHCAQIVCDMGMRPSYLVLKRSHGVYIKNMAQITIKDCSAVDNIIPFGGCMSPENPMTLAAAQEITKQVYEETGMDYQENAADLFMAETEDGKTVMQCLGECMPIIVSVEWDKEKEDVYVEPGKKALIGAAALVCKYGGIIKIIDPGQPESE